MLKMAFRSASGAKRRHADLLQMIYMICDVSDVQQKNIVWMEERK